MTQEEQQIKITRIIAALKNEEASDFTSLSLRIAIEGLMDITNQRPPHPNFQNAEAIEYGQEDGKIFARAALESICDQWPEV
jgi:hypothetical protein